MGSKFYHTPTAVVKWFSEISTKASQIPQTLSIFGRKNYTLPQLICQEKFLCRFCVSTNPTFDTDAPR
nr:MAG TPA: hypothetical protein [Caudoviricetes sp.]